MHFQIGAHPAFYFPAFDMKSNERGYLGFDRTEDLKYILISEKGCADPEHEYPLRLTDGLLPLDTHTFDRDALILENNQVEKVTLYNKEKQPYLSLRFTTPVDFGHRLPRMPRSFVSNRGTDVVTVLIMTENIKIKIGCSIYNLPPCSKEDMLSKLKNSQNIAFAHSYPS